MQKCLFLFLMCTLLTFGQAAFKPSLTQQTKAYCKVISEYIKAVTKNKEPDFDTLYIGYHEASPKIKWPLVIENKTIKLQPYKTSKTKVQYQPSFVLINIIALKVETNEANFMVVTFHKGYQPQHNGYVNLQYNPVTTNFSLDKEIRFEYVYKKKN